MRRLALVLALLVAAPAGALTVGGVPPGMALVPGGTYRPLYRQPVSGANRDTVLRRIVPVDVAPFLLDRFPVTNEEYLAFVRAHPEWRRSRASRLFTDTSYLSHWRGDFDPGPRAPAHSPVVHVSWFAARACLATQGKRLPTVAEWERAAAADEARADASRDARFLERIRAWSAQPTPDVLPAVGGRFRNLWGIEDLHGLVWEWALDFNSALVSGESRGDASLERGLFCGAGATNAGDFGDYAAFMRFAYRASLEARYTTANLGFRGARDAGGAAEVKR